jgi:hypothetical protein
MRKTKWVAFVVVAGIVVLAMLSLGSVPGEDCPCVLVLGCGCCPEYHQGSTTWHLVAAECSGIGGVCTYRNCVYA